jgi:hypothetical protein
MDIGPGLASFDDKENFEFHILVTFVLHARICLPK